MQKDRGPTSFTNRLRRKKNNGTIRVGGIFSYSGAHISYHVKWSPNEKGTIKTYKRLLTTVCLNVHVWVCDDLICLKYASDMSKMYKLL